MVQKYKMISKEEDEEDISLKISGRSIDGVKLLKGNSEESDVVKKMEKSIDGVNVMKSNREFK